VAAATEHYALQKNSYLKPKELLKIIVACAFRVNIQAWCGRCRGTQRDAEEQLSKARAVAESKVRRYVF